MKKKTTKATTAKVAEAPVKTTKKVASKKTTEKPISKAKAAKLDDANATSVTNEAVKKKITKIKDLKYIYPKSVDDLAKRKAFRGEVRRKIAAFEKALGQLEHSDLKEDQELFEAKSEAYFKYRTKVLVNPERV